jgi:hypothetical protein
MMLKFEKLTIIFGNLIWVGMGGLGHSIFVKPRLILFWILFTITMIGFTITFNKINYLSKKIERKEDE